MTLSHTRALTIFILALLLLVGSVWFFTRQSQNTPPHTQKQDTATPIQNTSPKETASTQATVQTNAQDNSSAVSAQQVTTDTSQSANAGSDIDTSNWKEYCNEEYGFCVKYPEGWEVKAHDTPFGFDDSGRPHPTRRAHYLSLRNTTGTVGTIGIVAQNSTFFTRPWRSGMPVGTFVKAGTIMVRNTPIEKWHFVSRENHKEKVSSIWYCPVQTTEKDFPCSDVVFTADKKRFHAELNMESATSAREFSTVERIFDHILTTAVIL